MKIEFYYGYYKCVAQVWDTMIIDIPKKMQRKSHDIIKAWAMVQAESQLTKLKLLIAFYGVLGIRHNNQES